MGNVKNFTKNNCLATRCLDKRSVNKTRSRIVSPIPATSFVIVDTLVDSQQARYFGDGYFSWQPRCWANNENSQYGRSFRKGAPEQEAKQEAGAAAMERGSRKPDWPTFFLLPCVSSIGALLDFTKKHCSRFGIIRYNFIIEARASKIAESEGTFESSGWLLNTFNVASGAIKLSWPLCNYME